VLRRSASSGTLVLHLNKSGEGSGKHDFRLVLSWRSLINIVLIGVVYEVVEMSWEKVCGSLAGMLK
jgi:hypothetical protein